MQFKDKTELVRALSDLKEEPIYLGKPAFVRRFAIATNLHGH